MFALAYSPCFGCKRVFGYNPNRVPSIVLDDCSREPICKECVEWVNPLRIKNGVPPIVLDPEAYEPCDEYELD